MTAPQPLGIEAFVTAVERPAIVAACRHLCDVLRDGAGRMWPVRLSFGSFAAGDQGPAEPIAIASLAAEVDDMGRSMEAVEALWRDRLRGKLDPARRQVLLCTVFKGSPDLRADPVRLRRMRALNRLVPELSLDYNALVVEVDRMLSFLGAEALRCDYRLDSTPAAEAAGFVVVSTLLAADLAPYVPPEAQAAALARHGGLMHLGPAVERRLRQGEGAAP